MNLRGGLAIDGDWNLLAAMDGGNSWEALALP